MPKKWYSFKHKAWATVTDEPVSKNGFYTIEFPEKKVFRRYNVKRINSEVRFLKKAFKEGVLVCLFE